MLLESTVTSLTTLPTAHPASEAVRIRTAAVRRPASPARFARTETVAVTAPRA
jgi:hypothetical protein